MADDTTPYVPQEDPAKQDPNQAPANTQDSTPDGEKRQKAEKAPKSPSRALTSLAKLLGRAPHDTEDDAFRKLLSLTGYKERDVLGYNADTRTFVTSNGGKYELKKSGKSFRTILGPKAPSETATPEDED